mgnify:CR=1 FL=1
MTESPLPANPMPRKKLPIGIQTLSEIIEGGYYYVDKTALAQQLIANGKYYFLSRPRRFGKSLFLNTLKEIFEGNQPLFQGLQIHDHWDWTRRHPVIRISFGGRHFQNPEELAASLHKQLDAYERQFALPARYPDNPSRFDDLITRLHQQTGQQVVCIDDQVPTIDGTMKDPHITAGCVYTVREIGEFATPQIEPFIGVRLVGIAVLLTVVSVGSAPLTSGLLTSSTSPAGSTALAMPFMACLIMTM